MSHDYSNSTATYQRRQDAVTCESNLIRIPEDGQGRNVWGKRYFLVLSFTGAPRTEFGETLGRWSK